jgi:hypothetical protein
LDTTPIGVCVVGEEGIASAFRSSSRNRSCSGSLTLTTFKIWLFSLGSVSGDRVLAAAALAAEEDCGDLVSRLPLGLCGRTASPDGCCLRLDRAAALVAAAKASSPLSAPLICVLPLLRCLSTLSCDPSPCAARGEFVDSLYPALLEFRSAAEAAVCAVLFRFEDIRGETTGARPVWGSPGAIVG